MSRSIIFLAVLAVSQAAGQRLTEPHPGCLVSGHWLLPHEYDCEYFYYCEGGQKFIEPTKCAPGTQFSFALQVCTHPYLANCDLPGYPPSDEPETEAPSTTAPTQAPTTAAPTTETSTTVAPTVAPTEVTTVAPTDSPTEAPTEAPTETPTEVPTETTTTAATEEPTTASTEAPTTPDVCENPNQNIVNCEEECNALPWAHDDCDKFWMCIDGVAVVKLCSEGLHFNPKTHTCDFMCNVDCVRANIQTTSDHNGLRLFIPWSQIQTKTVDVLKLIGHI